MIKKYKLSPFIAISLVFVLASCTHRVTLSVLVDDPELRQNSQQIKYFLLNEKDAANIEQIRTVNAARVRGALANAQDSLRFLYRDYMTKEIIYKQLKSDIENRLSKLKVDYCANLRIEIIQIQKMENTWNFLIKIRNDGPELVEGVCLTMKFKKEKLVSANFLPVEIPPHQTILNNQINIDLRDNFPLAYQLSSFPGGLAELPKSIVCRIDSVKSGFNSYLAESAVKLSDQKRVIEETGLLIDEFPSLKSLEIQNQVADPINRIIENNLNSISTPGSGKASSDTVRFHDLKAGKYTLIAYTAPADSNQWHQNLSLESDRLITFSPQERSPYFIRITQEMLSYRPFQVENSPKIK